MVGKSPEATKEEARRSIATSSAGEFLFAVAKSSNGFNGTNGLLHSAPTRDKSEAFQIQLNSLCPNSVHKKGWPSDFPATRTKKKKQSDKKEAKLAAR